MESTMASAAYRISSLMHIRALIVDDDEFMLDLTHDMLKHIGILSVATANSVSAALAQYDKTGVKPNLVLADLHMPGSDGFQFMDALAARNYSGAVILISGQKSHILNSAGLIAQLHQLRVLASLEKPANEHALRAAIMQMIN
jgi:CheY-like chemotaxis protein